ncbi:phage tail tape measure protein [Mycobacterium sp. NPDC050041]|uniref:phage tail tape measure protein n=1 Tax=Mycobacterium sp. NPDC050041 TaxID=3364293 RepID=UPI003C2CBF81
MTTPIGYAPLQIIPTLDGVSATIDRQLGGTLKAAGKRSGKEFGAAVADGVKASEADVKKAFDNHAKLADKAADATGKLKVAQAGYNELVQKGVTEGKRYEAAVAAKEKAARDEARAIKTATDALRDYKRAAEDAKSSGAEASSGFLAGLKGSAAGAASAGSGAAASFAQGFSGSSALMGLATRGGPIGIAIAAAGVAMGGLLWTNIKAGIDREPGRDLVQARLGASDAEIANIARTSGKVYANNFGESRDEAMRASQLAIQGGLVANAFDPALQQVSERLLAIGQLVGAETEEVAKSASILFRSGMADSAEQAFDIIAKGYQVTGDLGADWLDSIGEYSSGWKNAGLTAQQSLALIKQAQDNGVDVTDRSADALREFGRRITEEGPKMVEILDAIGLNGAAMYDKFKAGGPEAFEAFDTVFDKIRAIEDPVDRNQAALALLGDTAGDFVGSFAQWDPSAAVDALGQIDGAARTASDTMGDNVAGSFESAQRNIDIAMEGVQDSLAAAFGPSLETLATGVTTHKDEITDAFFTMGEVGVRLSQAMLASFGAIVGAIGLFGQALGDTYGLVMRLGEGIATITGDDEKAEQFRKDADAAFGFGEGLTALADGMVEASKDDSLIESLRRTRDGLRDTEDAADGAKGGIGRTTEAFDNLHTSIDRLPSTLPPWFKDMATGKPGPTPILEPGSDPFAIPGGPGYSASPGGGTPAAPSGTVIPGPDGSGGITLKSNEIPLPPGSGGPPSEAQVKQIAERFGLQVTSEDRPGARGYHGQGKALDIGKPGTDKTPEMRAFADYMSKTFGPNLLELIHDQPGFTGNVKDGRGTGAFGNVYTMEQAGYHGDHVHIAADWGGGAAPAPAPTSTPTAGLPAGAKGDAVAAGIIAEGQRRGWSQEQILAALGIANQETGYGTNPRTNAVQNQNGTAGITGVFQQDMSYRQYGDPRDPANAIKGFMSEFEKRGQGLKDPNPWRHAVEDVQIPADVADDGYSDGTGEYLKNRQRDQALETYNRLAGAGNVALSSNTTTAPTITGPGSPDLTNAYGAGYKPGIGTPGYNEYGEPGYYETDPRRISQAQRSVEDNKQRIADTETAVTDADTALADALKERDRIAQMTEVQRIAQGEDLDKANSEVDRAQKQADRSRLEAERAKEDAQWVQEDLNEAMQGSFSPAKKDSSSTSSKSGTSGSGLSLPSTFSGFGSAIGEFAGGQIGSALDVFGVGDSPPFLQAASKLLSGFKIGGDDRLPNGQLSGKSDGSLFDGGNMFAGAAPLTATSSATGAPMDSNVHGTRANQAPGPVYNIRTATVEDAFIKARRIENEKALSKTSRF